MPLCQCLSHFQKFGNEGVLSSNKKLPTSKFPPPPPEVSDESYDEATQSLPLPLPPSHVLKKGVAADFPPPPSMIPPPPPLPQTPTVPPAPPPPPPQPSYVGLKTADLTNTPKVHAIPKEEPSSSSDTFGIQLDDILKAKGKLKKSSASSKSFVNLIYYQRYCVAGNAKLLNRNSSTIYGWVYHYCSCMSTATDGRCSTFVFMFDTWYRVYFLNWVSNSFVKLIFCQ